MIYRIFKKEDSEVKEINGIKISTEVIYVETSKALDIDKWDQEGVYIKEYDEVPEKNIKGEKIKLIKMKG